MNSTSAIVSAMISARVNDDLRDNVFFMVVVGL